MDNGHVLAPATYERALLLEAVALLTQSQVDTENALGEQLAHTGRRMAALEERCDEFESRLTSIDERLEQLAVEIQPPPDPEIEHRLRLLKTQLERLSGRSHGQQVIPAEPRRAPVEPRPLHLESPPAAVEPRATAAELRARAAEPRPTFLEPRPVAGPEPPTPAAQVAPPPPPAAAQRVRPVATAAAPTATVWDYLGTSPKDRAAIVLMGLGLVAVLYATLVQLHIG